MTNTTVVNPVEDELIRNVPSLILTNEICDACGGTVKAAHVAYKDDMRLFFCKHHARGSAGKLQEQGFIIEPSDLGF